MILGDTQKEHELQQKEKTQRQGDIANTKNIQATLQDSKAMDNGNVHKANANTKLQKQVKIQKYYFLNANQKCPVSMFKTFCKH